MKVIRGVARHKAYTPEQQLAYDKLLAKQRKYVDYRVQGMRKIDAYKLAGYSANRGAGQNASMLEKRNPMLTELINARKIGAVADTYAEPDGEVAKAVDALALQSKGEQIMEAVCALSPEEAEKLAFLKGVFTGKITTKKVIRKYNSAKELLSEIVEETSDITNKMKAREMYDRMLGLYAPTVTDSMNVGTININFVNATKTEEPNVEILDMNNYAEECINIQNAGGAENEQCSVGTTD